MSTSLTDNDSLTIIPICSKWKRFDRLKKFSKVMEIQKSLKKPTEQKIPTIRKHSMHPKIRSKGRICFRRLIDSKGLLLA